MIETFTFLGFAGIIPYLFIQTVLSKFLKQKLKLESSIAINFGRHFLAFCLYLVFLFFMLSSFFTQANPTKVKMVVGIYFILAIVFSLFFEIGNLFVQTKYINNNPKAGKMSKAMVSILFFIAVVLPQSTILKGLSSILPNVVHSSKFGGSHMIIFFYHLPAYLLGLFLFGLYEFKKWSKE